VRPHDLELLDEPHDRTIPVQVKRLIHLGKEVHAELLLDDGRLINVQLPQEVFTLPCSAPMKLAGALPP
jgi:sulfate transport system ATP-binding protein